MQTALPKHGFTFTANIRQKKQISTIVARQVSILLLICNPSSVFNNTLLRFKFLKENSTNKTHNVLTAEYPATLKQPPKIGRYGDTQSLHTYLCICVST